MIFHDIMPIRDIAHEHYHKNVALVDQMPTLFNGTIRSNIMYGYEWETEEEMLEAAKMANIHEFIMGIKEWIQYGMDPKVLILDEATSELDVESESLIQEALKKCAKGRTVIVVAHRMATVRHVDRIFVIKKAKIVQEGTELLEDTAGLYHTLVTGSSTFMSFC